MIDAKMQSYLVQYSPGENARMTLVQFRAETDDDAFAIAVQRAPDDAVALHLSRYRQLEYVGGGAMPAHRKVLVNDIGEMAERFAATGKFDQVQS